MRILKLEKKYYIFLAVVFFFFILFTIFANKVFAQAQDFTFSGNDADSYQCFDSSGNVIQGATITKDQISGKFICPDGSAAGLKPPTLQQLEIWFVRIIYVVWGLTASFSFILLIILGYQYMISRGDVTKITQIRERIIKYIFGVAIVFLAIPILTSFFNVLGISQNVSCYNVEMPGFQFFFYNMCTDPRGVDTNPCELSDLFNGLGATGGGDNYACSSSYQFKPAQACGTVLGGLAGVAGIGFCCVPIGSNSSGGVWETRIQANCAP